MRHYPYLALSFIVGILLMVGYIFFLLFGPYVTPVLDNITPTDPVTAGHLARYTAQQCKTTKQEAEVSRTLVSQQDGVEVIIGLDSAVIRRVVCSNIMLIPLSVPTGDYILTITAKIHVNPVRTVIREYKSVKFHVYNPNPDAVIPPEISEVPVVPITFSPSPTQSVTENPSSPSVQQSPSSQSSQPSPSPSPTPKPTQQPTLLSPVVDAVNNLIKRVGL